MPKVWAKSTYKIYNQTIYIYIKPKANQKQLYIIRLTWTIDNYSNYICSELQRFKVGYFLVGHTMSHHDRSNFDQGVGPPRSPGLCIALRAEKWLLDCPGVPAGDGKWWEELDKLCETMGNCEKLWSQLEIWDDVQDFSSQLQSQFKIQCKIYKIIFESLEIVELLQVEFSELKNSQSLIPFDPAEVDSGSWKVV